MPFWLCSNYLNTLSQSSLLVFSISCSLILSVLVWLRAARFWSVKLMRLGPSKIVTSLIRSSFWEKLTEGCRNSSRKAPQSNPKVVKKSMENQLYWKSWFLSSWPSLLRPRGGPGVPPSLQKHRNLIKSRAKTPRCQSIFAGCFCKILCSKMKPTKQ